MRLVVLALLVGLGLTIATAWGGEALAVYAFFAVLAVVLVYGAAAGGELVQRVSRSRFEDRDRRRG
jgi:hypothetical protein